MPKSNEIYYYIRGEAKGKPPKGMKKTEQNGPPIITVCISPLEDGYVCRGIAICSSKDMPNKKEGRRIARNYMLRAKGIKKSSKYISGRKDTETDVPYFLFHSIYQGSTTMLEDKLLKVLRKRSENHG